MKRARGLEALRLHLFLDPREQIGAAISTSSRLGGNTCATLRNKINGIRVGQIEMDFGHIESTTASRKNFGAIVGLR